MGGRRLGEVNRKAPSFHVSSTIGEIVYCTLLQGITQKYNSTAAYATQAVPAISLHIIRSLDMLKWYGCPLHSRRISTRIRLVDLRKPVISLAARQTS
jgi:hypothetical protein